MFDLANLDTSKTAETGVAVTLRHPVTHVPLGARIFVAGVDSDTYRSQLRKQQNRRMEQARRNRGQLSVSAEELENDALDLLVGCTKGWESDIEEHGEKKTVAAIPFGAEGLLPCTPENVRKIYSHPGFAWLREQVDAEIGDRANFLAK